MAEEKRVSGVLVVGAGIGGIKAALELAEFGAQVYLCDHKPYIGGILTRLDKWFPDNHCGMCKILPVFDRDKSSQYCLRQGLIHPNINILPLTNVEKVEGEAGNFQVTLGTESSLVKPELCIGCGLCAHECPIEIDSEFNQGLEKQKAIHLRHPLMLPKTYIIDSERCTKCGACVDVCPTKAIDLSGEFETREVAVGAIILSTGFEEYDPLPATQYGYKRYRNVITSIEMERQLSSTGPSGGRLIRPSDGKIPKSIAFIQCVGSRDLKRNYCSSACCMYALKEAMIIKAAEPKADVSIFFMDFRAFGKGYHRYYEQARDELGIEFIRCRVPVVNQDFGSSDLLINAIVGDSIKAARRFELVVLSVGQIPSSAFSKTTETLGLTTNKWGFCNTEPFSLVATVREGVFVCGCASGPKDIADTIVEAEAVAGQAATLVTPNKHYSAETDAPEAEDPEIAVFICNCKGLVAEAADTRGLAEFARQLSNVTYVEEVELPCKSAGWQALQTNLKKSGANRAIVVGCSALRPSIPSADVPVELVNIREELAWVHQASDKTAADKGKSQLAMAVEKIRYSGKRTSLPETVTPRTVVIGGGLSGLVAALSIAEHGFEVELLEKTCRLGGNVSHIYSLLEGGNPQEYLQHLTEKVNSNSLIHVNTETEVVQTTGYVGNFRCTLEHGNSELHEIKAGAIIVAIGGDEYQPTEYLYGQTETVITQRELEERLAQGILNAKDLSSVVMIQCVGSREEARPYCSRICCSQALKNALNLKRQNPEIEIIILYRDLMSYGFKEEFYTLAREKGVLFIRYDLERKPELTRDGAKLVLKATDPVVGESIVVKPDLVVLSPAIIPKENKKLSRTLGVELTEDGFFEQAESKFRPVDTLKEGIFVCGLAHSPRGVTETIAQAQAAAQRAALLLGRPKLTAGRKVSRVNERRCNGCELCIAVCPYDARVKDLERGVVIVRESLCQGCGACVTACPNAATSLVEFGDKQIFSMIDVAI